MSVDQVPMLIEQGFGAIAIAFDVWGLAGLVAGNLAQAREFAQAPPKTVVNGVANSELNGAANGKLNGAANGKLNGAANGELKEAANGELKGAANGEANGKTLTT
jgi:4-hydroxy-2-oxoheptanedioate aldolase